MPEWLTWLEHFISAVGFPIAVACFLLWSAWEQQRAMIEAIRDLRNAIEVLTTKIT